MIKNLLIAFLVSLLFSCDKEIQKKPTKNIIVLFDCSGSAEKLKEQYAENLGNIISKIDFGDTLIASKISGSSLTETKIPFLKEFSEFSGLDKRGNAIDNDLLLSKALKEATSKLEEEKAKAIEEAKNKVIYAPVEDGTEILSSLIVVEKLSKKFKRDKTILVIFSDMEEWSGKYKFNEESLTDQRISKIIEKEKSTNQIPDLKDIVVNVIASGSKRDSKKYQEIKNFWIKYLKDAGANIKDEDYNSFFSTIRID
jgi:hypothetical protein